MNRPAVPTSTSPISRLRALPFPGPDAHPAAHFYENSISAGTRERYAHDFEKFQAWCAVYGVTSLPADPMHLLCFLHQHRDAWGWHRMYKVVDAVQHHHRDEGAPDVKTDLVRQYLTIRKREVGKYAEAKQVDAIQTEEARIMAEHLRGRVDKDVAGIRAVVALAHATGSQDLIAISAELANGLVEVTSVEGETRVEIRGRRGDLDQSTPMALSSVQSLRTSDDERACIDNGLLTSTVNAAWRRSGLEGDPAKTLARLDAADLDWLVASIDPDHDDVTRLCAYLLIGHALGRRHAELAELQLKNFSKRAGGWQVLITRSKTDQQGQGHVLPLDHEFEDGAGCDAICGACAADRLIETHARRHGRTLQDTARLIPATMATDEPWSTKQARNTLKRWWLSAGLDPNARIGTRSIRVGTVTSLSRRGASIEEISRVTLHVTQSWVLRYLRQHDPENWQAFLPL